MAAYPMEKHPLEIEFRELLRNDPEIFDFLERSTLDGIWYWDLEHPEHEWMSETFWRTFGYDPAEKQHLAAEWQNMVDPNDLEAAIANFEAHCANPDHPYDQIVRYRHKNGHMVWVRCRGMAIRDPDGKPIRMLGAHTNITELHSLEHDMLARERKKQEELAHHAKLRNRLERIANIGTWEVDLLTNEVHWSEQTKRIHEVPADYVPTLDAGIHFYEEGKSRELISHAVALGIDTGTPWDLELAIITAKHHRIWVRAMGEAEFSDGRCVRLFGTFQDISEYRRLSDIQRRENERLELVLESSGLGLWDWNPQTGQVIFDARWSQLLGHTPDDIAPSIDSWMSRIHPDDLDRCRREIDNHLLGETEVYQSVCRMRHRDGHWVYLQGRGKVMARNFEGDPIRFTGTHELVTAREKARQQQQQLYAMTAHELRTPLAALEMMCNTDQPDEWWSQKAFFEHALQDVFHTLDDMRMLINPEIKRPIRITAVNLPEFNKSIVVATSAVVASNSFKMDLIDDLPQTLATTTVELDSYRLRASIVNLIRNACLHSQGTRVWLRCATAEKGGVQYLQWDVEDNGVGVDPPLVANLFQPFARGNQSTEGTGMGLHIARSWVEEIGGSLTYRHGDHGSTFRIRAPLVIAPETREPTLSATVTATYDPAHSAPRVLLAEDDRMLRMLGEKLLRNMGAQVETAEDGAAALAQLDNDFDLVLTDFYMPKMTGLDLLKQAKLRGIRAKIVVLTAANLSEELDKLELAGADKVLIKPLNVRMLQELFESLELKDSV